MDKFKSCPSCKEQSDQCLLCASYVVDGERIYYEKLKDFGATQDHELRFINRIQKHRTTAFFHNGKLYIPSRQGRSVPLAIGLQWEAWQEQQAEIDQLKNLLEKDEYAHNLYYENANLQTLVEEKDKRVEELERSCISYKNQRDDYAQKLMVKSVQYSSIQEELAKLKDRLELAHHLATQSTWSSLKQLKKVVKALRGEHE